jgi:glycosyltransferase involved in cell wall biosynthesis
VLDRESGSESKIASDLLRIYIENAGHVKILTSSLTSQSEVAKLRAEFDGKVEIHILEFPRIFVGHGRVILLLGIRWWHQKALKKKTEQIYFSDVDLGVHLSFATFLFGTPLSRLSIPYIFGPAGFSMFSRNSTRIFGMKSLAELFRNLIVDLILRIDPYVRRSLTKASVVIPTDLNSRQIVQDRIHLTNLTVPIPHISFTRFESSKSTKSNRLIWVGHFLQKKDPHLALEAFEKVADSLENFTLHFHGDGPLEKQLRNAILASHFKSRIFIGSWLTSKELHHEISKSEILLHTTVRETAGNQILESVLLGTKVISSNRTNLFSWLRIPGLSYVQVDSLISRKELVLRYAREISDWCELEQMTRVQMMDSSQAIMKSFTPMRIVKSTLHEYFFNSSAENEKEE